MAAMAAAIVLVILLGSALAMAAPTAPVLTGPTDILFIAHPRGFRATISWVAPPTATRYTLYDGDGNVLSSFNGPRESAYAYGQISTPYSYYLVAFDADGAASPPSNTIVIQNLTPPTPPAAPSGFTLIGTSWVDATTSSPATGTVSVAMSYDAAWVTGDESQLKLFHYTAGAWHDVTTSVDTVNNVVHGQTSSLSPFALGEPVGGPANVPASSDWSLAAAAMAAMVAAGIMLARRGSTQG
jgi:hypothetical protein